MRVEWVWFRGWRLGGEEEEECMEPSQQSVLCSPGRSLATDVLSICGKLISR